VVVHVWVFSRGISSNRTRWWVRFEPYMVKNRDGYDVDYTVTDTVYEPYRANMS